MKRHVSPRWIAQAVLVVACAFSLKLFYSKATADQLRWILAPTASCVELVSGARFQFESHAGYLSGDRAFLIAPSCAGVNFMITALVMLCAGKLLRNRAGETSWTLIPTAALAAYVVTIAANAIRIVVALQLRSVAGEIEWLNPNQLHRCVGILIYFGFLLLLFLVCEQNSSERTASLFRRSLFPLLVYYVTTIGIPLAGGAFQQSAGFWEYALFVLVTPLAVVLTCAVLRFGATASARRIGAGGRQIVCRRCHSGELVGPQPEAVHE
jgi:exosortase K